MKEYNVAYELGDILHSRVIKADNEYNAILKVMLNIPFNSQDIFKNLRVRLKVGDTKWKNKNI